MYLAGIGFCFLIAVREKAVECGNWVQKQMLRDKFGSSKVSETYATNVCIMVN